MQTLYLLFSDFEFDFETPLPARLGNGVWLDQIQTVDLAINRPENAAVPPMVVPHQVAGVAQVHVCMRTTIASYAQLDAGLQKLWWALIALRLFKPFRFETSGYVLINNHEVVAFQSYPFVSMVNPGNVGTINRDCVVGAAAIGRAVRPWRGAGLIRPRSAMIFFAQSTMGLVNSWQLSMLGLFAALEAVFPQPKAGAARRLAHPDETYNKRLSRRVAGFLGTRAGLNGTEAWLARVYEQRRNSLAHGVAVASARRSQLQSNSNDLVRLHETVRLVLLGMAGIPAQTHKLTLPVEAGELRVQQEIDRRLPAPELLLTGQSAYLARRG